MKRKALVVSSYPAPYRVGVFKELSKNYDLDIFFDTSTNENRNTDWFCKSGDIEFVVLNNKQAQKRYKERLSNISEYDFILAYDPARKPTIKAIVMCQLHKVPYYVNNDGAFIHKKFLRDSVKRFLFGGAKACFSSGKSATEYFKYYGVPEERIFTHKFSSLRKTDILNTPMTEEIKTEKRSQLQIEDKYTVITVGQFIPRKGFDVLLQAWKEIGDSAQLLIIGGGDEKKNYEEYIHDYNIKGVHLVDFMKKEELFQYYLASDLFVLPTREDVWGLVINEAMAVGLPVITTNRCNAGLELIEDDVNGYIVPVGDSVQLAEKIRFLLTHPELMKTMSKNNLEKIREYTIEGVAISHIGTIEKTLS